MKVALTQGAGRLEGLEGSLEALGYDVVRVPLVATVARVDAAATAAANALIDLPWRLYPSRSAVEAWRAIGCSHHDRARLGAVGPGTRRALELDAGRAVVEGAPATAAGLASVVVRASDHRDGPIGVVQGSRARPTLANALRISGFEVRVATIYDTLPRPWPVGLQPDAVVLASPSAVAALPRAVGAAALLVAIGPTTAAALHRRAWRALEASEPTADGVLDALRRAPSRAGQTHARNA